MLVFSTSVLFLKVWFNKTSDKGKTFRIFHGLSAAFFTQSI